MKLKVTSIYAKHGANLVRYTQHNTPHTLPSRATLGGTTFELFSGIYAYIHIICVCIHVFDKLLFLIQFVIIYS